MANELVGRQLSLRERTLTAGPAHPLVMGIVNANPDSFSDRQSAGERNLQAVIARGLQMIEDGADLLDVGGETAATRTDPVGGEREIARVVPVIEALAATGAIVSIDTTIGTVAEAALAAGAQLVNDISGLADVQMAAIAADHGAGLVIMHTRAPPKVVNFHDYGGDVWADVISFLTERRQIALDAGLSSKKILLDPGPDFAKRPQETVACLRSAAELAALGSPWLAAVSRKYFLAAAVPRRPDQRDALTLAAIAHAADAGAAVVRVHDVRATVDFLAARDMLAGRSDPLPVDCDDERLKWL